MAQTVKKAGAESTFWDCGESTVKVKYLFGTNIFRIALLVRVLHNLTASNPFGMPFGSAMPLIGFTLFHDEVRDGTKRQTIRRNRKLPVKVGDTLYLYWHPRKKDCHLLRVKKCVETFTRPWGVLKVSEDIAQRDGFKSSAEMREWFSKTHPLPDDEELFDVIRW